MLEAYNKLYHTASESRFLDLRDRKGPSKKTPLKLTLNPNPLSLNPTCSTLREPDVEAPSDRKASQQSEL